MVALSYRLTGLLKTVYKVANSKHRYSTPVDKVDKIGTPSKGNHCIIILQDTKRMSARFTAILIILTIKPDYNGLWTYGNINATSFLV